MSSWVRSWLLSPSQGGLVQDEPGSVSAWGVRDADRRRATQFPSRRVSLGGPVGRTGGRSTTHFAMDTVGCQASDRCPSFCSSGATFATTRPAETHARVDLGAGRRLPATAGSWPLIASDAFLNPPRGTPGRMSTSRCGSRTWTAWPECAAATTREAARVRNLPGTSPLTIPEILQWVDDLSPRRLAAPIQFQRNRLQTCSAPHTATCPPYL